MHHERVNFTIYVVTKNSNPVQYSYYNALTIYNLSVRCQMYIEIQRAISLVG